MKTPSVIGIKKELQGKFLLTNLTISVSGLPRSFEDYKIVQLTDLHYGCATNESHLNQAVEITNNLNP
nr:hypothetical protein [Pseudomonadota bacterium]